MSLYQHPISPPLQLMIMTTTMMMMQKIMIITIILALYCIARKELKLYKENWKELKLPHFRNKNIFFFLYGRRKKCILDILDVLFFPQPGKKQSDVALHICIKVNFSFHLHIFENTTLNLI